jgi:hypothetical protein
MRKKRFKSFDSVEEGLPSQRGAKVAPPKALTTPNMKAWNQFM